MDERVAINAYIAGLPEPQRSMIESVRSTIHEASPDAAEVVSYRMPGFRLRGKLLLSYAAYKRHCAIYPASGRVMEALGPELRPFLAERATIRFTPEQPLPDDLLRRVVEVRREEIAEATAGR